MRKLFLIYGISIVLIFTLPVLLSSIGKMNIEKHSPKKVSEFLPNEIAVYFKDENVTKLIEFEEYLKGVVPAEVPALFHMEAIKAQAVAARTYAYNKYVKFTKDPNTAPAEHKDAIVCTDSKHCNAYYSKEQLLEKHGQSWMDSYYKKYVDAVEQTRGQILVYNEEPILAVFHSSSAGGVTQNCKDVWGGNLPYLVSVKSDGEEDHNGYETTVVVPSKEFEEKIKNKYNEAQFPKDKKKWFSDISYVEGESIGTIKVGGVTVKGVEMRSIFNLRSTHFKIDIDGDNFVFTVDGSGHGVGMSQYGANYMAQNGSSYEQILVWYYKGAKLKS